MKKNIHFNILLLLLLVEAMTVHAFAQTIYLRYHNNSVLNGKSEHGNKAHGRRYIQCHTAYIERKHSAKERQRHDGQHQTGLPEFPKRSIKQNKHTHQCQRKNDEKEYTL